MPLVRSRCLQIKRASFYFEKSAKVFHTNYFRDPDTLQFIADRLGI
jgi:hypothetical protein